ncbi:MAG: hypothetical protein RSD40_06745, partial [Bacilli bacterium]
GGVKLERQELRNSLGSGDFNNILFELARLNIFRNIWGLPHFTEEELENHKLPIYEIAFFKKMEDLEVVLRFFALRHMNNFKLGIQGFLDLFMIRSKNFSHQDCNFLKTLYTDTINTAYAIYDINVFKTHADGQYSKSPMKGVYDGVMVGLSNHYGHYDLLIAHKSEIIEKTIQLFSEKGISALTGRASTKEDLENRIQYFSNIFSEVIHQYV